MTVENILPAFIAAIAASIVLLLIRPVVTLIRNLILGSGWWRKRRIAHAIHRVDYSGLPLAASERVSGKDSEHDRLLYGELLVESSKAISAGKWGKRWRNLWYRLRFQV